MPSGWKCDLVAIQKMKEIYKQYEKKEGKYNPELTKAMQGLCGITDKQALNNIRAVEELLRIENSRINSKISKKTKLKQLSKPTMLVEISKFPEEKKEDVIEKIDNGELKTVKDVKEFRTGKKGKQKNKKSRVNVESNKEFNLGKLGDFKESDAIQWNIDLAIDNDTVNKLKESLGDESIIHWMRHILIDAIKKRIGE